MTAVCKECLSDPAFDKLFTDAYYLELLDVCDYCGKTGEQIALVVSELAGYIMEQVGKEYTDPVHRLSFCSEEGGYLGQVIDGPWNLFAEIDFELEDSQLMKDLCDSMGEVSFCRDKYSELTPAESLSYGWRQFCGVIKHQRRYTFWTANEVIDEFHPEYLSTSDVLGKVAESISTAKLAKPLDTDTKIWRARVHSSSTRLDTAADFAAPPNDSARFSNRMSPAGVSMFYGADSKTTAVSEVVGKRQLDEDKVVSVATFLPARELRLLDLADLPEVPSFFDDRDTLRHSLYFLIQFRRDVSQPIKKDGSEHIEYVPTQAFAEFIRHEVKGPTGEAIDGVRYNSAIGLDACFAIFADHKACLPEASEIWPTHKPLLRFEPNSVETLSPQQVAKCVECRNQKE